MYTLNGRISLAILFITISEVCIIRSGYKATLIVETTSDWTSIEFMSQRPVCLDIKKITKETNGVHIKPFKIDKNPYDSSKVIVEYAVFIPRKGYQGDTIIVKKGDIGYTKVQIRDLETSSGLFWINNKNIPSDPSNLMKFRISGKDFESIGIYSKPLKPSQPSIEPLVLAFYYPWYKIWHRGGKQITLHTPKIGFYNSADTSVIKSHIEYAKEGGIDCFIISWGGVRSFTDSVIQIMIPFLERSRMKFSVYLEQCDSLAQFVEIKKYLEKYLFNSPSYLVVNNKPTLFIYDRIPKKLRNVLIPMVADDIFIINHGSTFLEINQSDGFHVYLPILTTSELDSINQLASLIAHYHKKVFVATVYPGFDNRPSRFPGVKGKFIDREEGNFYRKTWKSAMAAEPDWIAIISFNEWGEATEIEPSLELRDKYLRITKTYAKRFKKQYR